MSAVLSQPFNIATHNGFITVVSNKTGQHRTVRIRTEEWIQRDRDGNVIHDDCGEPVKKAVRTVGLLTGQCNESDYTNFAMIADRGQVVLFRKNRDSEFFNWMAKFLESPARFPHIEFNFEGRCRRCNRLLTTNESVLSGIGPTCRELE